MGLGTVLGVQRWTRCGLCPRGSDNIPEVCVCEWNERRMKVRDGFMEKVAHERGHGWTWMGRDGRDRCICFTYKI